MNGDRALDGYGEVFKFWLYRSIILRKGSVLCTSDGSSLLVVLITWRQLTGTCTWKVSVGFKSHKDSVTVTVLMEYVTMLNVWLCSAAYINNH